MEPLSLPPLGDPSTFAGRLRHFAAITDMRLTVATERQLLEARQLLLDSKCQVQTPQQRKASALYQSAFHPDSGQLQNAVGRMSFQVPGGMLVTGAMMAFYRSTPAVVFWQWANQSFNALVNYTNRNAAAPLSTGQLAAAYVSATGAALGSALGLKRALANVKWPLLQRYVPFMAVAAANAVNIPLMRQSELGSGVPLSDEEGERVGHSKVAARHGISQVVFSRIVMAAPGMLAVPVAAAWLERRRWWRPAYGMPAQTLLCGLCLTFMVPLACALFPQTSSISVAKLKRSEPELYRALQERYGDRMPETLYYNKGL